MSGEQIRSANQDSPSYGASLDRFVCLFGRRGMVWGHQAKKSPHHRGATGRTDGRTHPPTPGAPSSIGPAIHRTSGTYWTISGAGAQGAGSFRGPSFGRSRLGCSTSMGVCWVKQGPGSVGKIPYQAGQWGGTNPKDEKSQGGVPPWLFPICSKQSACCHLRGSGSCGS